jgi:hypothetical protein
VVGGRDAVDHRPPDQRAHEEAGDVDHPCRTIDDAARQAPDPLRDRRAREQRRWSERLEIVVEHDRGRAERTDADRIDGGTTRGHEGGSSRAERLLEPGCRIVLASVGRAA